MAGLAVVTAKNVLRVFSGKRYLNLNFAELEHYRGERGRRGNKLPRGFQKVDSIAVVDA
jgi:topoisomerase-4 subunit A